VSGEDRRGEPHPETGIGNENLRADLERIVAEYPQRRAGALMCLHHVQQHRGCIGLEDQVLVAGVLGISPAHVRELVTFYTLFHERKPGRYHLQLCRTLSCHLRGALDLKRRIADRLGIAPGETTSDGRFTVTEVECLGSCGTAPVLQVNEDYFEALTMGELDEILDGLIARAGGPPKGSR
jgi:NADH-quinone oxidoreductase subunit E